jgi:hypothetical protein
MANARTSVVRGLGHIFAGHVSDQVVRPTAFLLFLLVGRIFWKLTAATAMLMNCRVRDALAGDDPAGEIPPFRDGRPAGSASVCSIVSFNGNKIMTTSGGGALLTDDGDFAQRIRCLATQARQPAAHYEHTEIGYNYRMSNLLAGLGRALLVRLPEMMIERRRQWRRRYRDLFADVAGVEFFGAPDGVDDPINHDNFWLTTIIVDSDVTGWST